ncbi:MAG: NAD-dependent epimerase/dehydratase family protein [Candidatus Brennerbacteria bacterium]|nr:NAD-dependent epimerase/dehydratase family protein [Candidatus Brennerbacteria bacterium]
MNKVKYLITGGTGFVGANFIRTFVARGDEVYVTVRSHSNPWRLSDIKDRVHFCEVNLEEEAEVARVVRLVAPEVILHFATYGGSQGREQDVRTTIAMNVLGTINLMRASVETGFSCFINTGTSSEYGEKDHPMCENELPEPNNLYGVTKAAATMFGRFLGRKHNLSLVTMRLFSVYGYYEDPRRLVPVVIKACLKNGELALASSSFVRDFVFIEDVIGAYDAAIAHREDIKGEVFNVGTGMQRTLGDVVTIVKRVTGATIEPSYGAATPVQHEPAMWTANVSKIKRMLGWEPEYSLEDGIAKNVEWFKQNPSLYQ